MTTNIKNKEQLDEYIIKHPNKPINATTIDFVGADLKNVDFDEQPFRDIDLEGFDFCSANLEGADLSYVDLTRVNLYNANLQNAILEGAELNNVNFHKANLKGLNIDGTNFYSKIDLMDTELISAQLGKHLAVFQPSTRRLNIGCQSHLLDYWLANYEEIGIDVGYSEKEIEIYHEFMQLCDLI
jgi:uncharacterized protein YjbI with pentapeptide repeats